MDETEVTLATYNTIASDYADRWATNDAVTEEARKRFLSHLPGSPVVADIGCGPGRDSYALNEAGCSVVGLDLSMAMLAEAAQRFKGPLVIADMRQLPFRPASFDGAWVCASLLHVPKRHGKTTTTSFRALLKPKGVLFVAVKQGFGETFRSRDGLRRFFAFYSQPELNDLITGSGFSILDTWVETDEVHPDPWINVIARAN